MAKPGVASHVHFVTTIRLIVQVAQEDDERCWVAFQLEPILD